MPSTVTRRCSRRCRAVPERFDRRVHERLGRSGRSEIGCEAAVSPSFPAAAFWASSPSRSLIRTRAPSGPAQLACRTTDPARRARHDCRLSIEHSQLSVLSRDEVSGYQVPWHRRIVAELWQQGNAGGRGTEGSEMTETLSVQERLFDVRGARAVVTGAATGLGFAMAEVLADCGARVTLQTSTRSVSRPRRAGSPSAAAQCNPSSATSRTRRACRRSSRVSSRRRAASTSWSRMRASRSCPG